jgi:hypothetical protein
MRRPIAVAFAGLVAAGCAASDVTEPQAPPDPIASPLVLLAPASAVSPNLGPALDDAIDRLVPALGPAATSIGQQLKQLRVAGGGDVQLIDATQRKLAALSRSLPPEALPDAEALAFTLETLRSAGT